jgi:HAMP domain-containing protein
VRLTAGALSLKILVHTILLFLLLKVRMEPLLALRSTVAGLARGVMDLSPRAAVKSKDEFGALAQDLNHFLDRIGVVVADLDRILSEVVAVGARLGALNRDLEQQVDSVRDASLRLLGEGAQRSLHTQLQAAHEAGTVQALQQSLAQTLAALDAGAPLPPGAAPALREQLQRLQQSFDAVCAALRAVVPPVVVGQAQSAEYQAFLVSLRQMALLEATMQKVAESGQQVLQRLAQGRNPTDAR